MYNGKEKLAAKESDDCQSEYSDYRPSKISFKELPLSHGWMRWAIYTSPEDAPEIVQLKQSIDNYNEIVDLVCDLPGFLDAFVASKLRLSRSEIEKKWGVVVADRLFSLKPGIFTTELFHTEEYFIGRLFGAVPEYQVDIPEYGSVNFRIHDYNKIEYRCPAGQNKVFDWNYADDERDFAASIWYSALSSMFDYEEAKKKDIPGFDAYDCWEQGRYDVDAVDRRLVKCLELLERYGYVKTYSISPEETHPCWNNTDKTDGTLDAMVLDLAFHRDKMLCEKLTLVLYSRDIYLGKELFFLTSSEGRLYLSSVPGNLGGHNTQKIYGRLDCPSAARYIGKGQYIKHRVFFADEETAILAGYRPCGVCMKDEYRKWKQQHGT